MSSFKGENCSLEHILSLPDIEELPRVRPPPSDSEEEDILFRVVQRPYRVDDLGVFVLPLSLAPVNPDLVGPSSVVLMMTTTNTLLLQGVYGILGTI